MNGISSDLYQQLRNTLFDCAPMESGAQIRALFIDQRIRPWRRSLPDGESAADRTDAIIAFLLDQYRADTNENALVLFLLVLSDAHDPLISCHTDLLNLAGRLEQELSGQSGAGGNGKSSASLEQFLQAVRDQLAEGDLALALDQVRGYTSANAPDLANQATTYSARYYQVRRDLALDKVTAKDAQEAEMDLVGELLALLDEIPGLVTAERSPAAAPEIVADVTMPEDVRFEMILGINNLKQISWFAKGLQVAESVGRILTPKGLGTGFLIGPNRLMTNNHVIGSSTIAAGSYIEFNYQQELDNSFAKTYRYRLDKDNFYTSKHLDYSIVGILPDPEKPPLETWAWLTLNPHADPVPGEHMIIIQHPNGALKQIVLTANQAVEISEHLLHYTTDTMPGSSGSPVFNDLWQVVGIHHAGGKLHVNKKGYKRYVNEAILMSAIHKDAGALWPIQE